MEVCEKQEAWGESKDKDLDFSDLEFTHTKVLLKEGDQYYCAKTSRRYRSTSEIDPLELDLVPIPASKIGPRFPAHFTRAPDPLPQGCYVKRTSMSHYGDNASDDLCGLLLDEAKVCEILMANPHPNLAQYLGCIVENDRITGICFVKYDTILSSWATQDSRSFDTGLILRGIKEGISHLHSLNLIHCDINPVSIYMNGDTPVIGDIESCLLGESTRLRSWTMG